VLDRANVQSGDEFLLDTWGAMTRQLEAVPVWAGDRITPQWLRSSGTVFSASIIAHVEATFGDDAQKNALCTPIVPPNSATDWPRMLEVSMQNQHRWSQYPGLQQWLAESRVNSLLHPAARVRPDMRGYGGTSAPGDAGAYTLLHLVGDMVELVRALKETQAVIVGHDWGAPVAWHAALLRPGLFRAIERYWELLVPWRGQVIRQPSMFIAGARDDVLKLPGSKLQIENFPKTLPGLRGCHILEGAGHWIQRERAQAVDSLLASFLDGL
jgi:pimeloyl-ACP methyl ester carboxylesterase